MDIHKDLIQQLKGRAKFCRHRGEIKTPELLERAAELLEAKAQAVPEGFVALAIDDVERICRCLDDHAVYITYRASDALESIQKAMIEAQEPEK